MNMDLKGAEFYLGLLAPSLSLQGGERVAAGRARGVF